MQAAEPPINGSVPRKAAFGMLNDECLIVGIGLDLMISEHSTFKIPHYTFDRSTRRLHFAPGEV